MCRSSIPLQRKAIGAAIVDIKSAISACEIATAAIDEVLRNDGFPGSRQVTMERLSVELNIAAAQAKNAKDWIESVKLILDEEET